MTTITLDLPLPHPRLHPNRKARGIGHRAALIRKARFDAGVVAKLSKPASCPWEAATVYPTFYMPRRQDGDNLKGWLKHYLDGIADAQVVVNDSVIRLMEPEQITGKTVGRKVVLRIERD